jgi:four helix bundle protein
MAFMFENLAVYQKSVDLADEILAATSEFPRGFYFLSDQLNRACISIATNLAEGNGRFTKADRRNFFVITRCSAQECIPLLDLACRRGLLSTEKTIAFRPQLEVIAKILSGLINGLEQRKTLFGSA